MKNEKKYSANQYTLCSLLMRNKLRNGRPFSYGKLYILRTKVTTSDNFLTGLKTCLSANRYIVSSLLTKRQNPKRQAVQRLKNIFFMRRLQKSNSQFNEFHISVLESARERKVRANITIDYHSNKN